MIEAVPAGEPPPRATHYLPHHAVVRQDKSTTKVRIVYDASAKSANGPSLNDCLLKGPKFNQLIFDLLLRFRFYKIALTADLEKAFLMVSVDEADRDVLRFIWVDDTSKDPPDLRVYRFIRVVFGVSSSPFLLNATIRFHLEKYLETNEGLVQQLLHSTYVDDIISGGHTEEEAFDLYTTSKKIFREGGFNLRKFLTNSKRLQEESISKRVQNLTIHHCRMNQPSQRLLSESPNPQSWTNTKSWEYHGTQSQTNSFSTSLTLPESLLTYTQLNETWSVLSASSMIRLDFSLQ